MSGEAKAGVSVSAAGGQERVAALTDDERFWLIAHKGDVIDIARDKQHADRMTASDWEVVEVIPSRLTEERVMAVAEVFGRREHGVNWHGLGADEQRACLFWAAEALRAAGHTEGGETL